MFKQIYLDGEPTRWSVNENGQVRNDQTGHFLTGAIMNGYRYINFRWNHKSKNKGLHRLIAETFLPNPNNLPVVHHKDGNRLNNVLSNLEWVTEEENRKYALPPKHDKNRKMPQGGTDEEWRTFRDSVYMVSTYGRVKNMKTNHIMRGSYDYEGYYKVELALPNKSRRKFLVHRLVYETFISPDIDVINHIDGDKSNNKLENLENVSHKENMRKASVETNVWNFRKVAQFDLEGNYIQTFLNASEAARAMGILPSTMRNNIRLNYKTLGKYIFKYIEKDEPSSTSP